jgi:hypothetical protein
VIRTFTESFCQVTAIFNPESKEITLTSARFSARVQVQAFPHEIDPTHTKIMRAKLGGIQHIRIVESAEGRNRRMTALLLTIRIIPAMMGVA